MSIVDLNTVTDLKAFEGKEIGVSSWVTVTQEMIDKFAEATGDHQWIHVDVERAKKEMPGGKTIAHGYLTLSLVPMMSYEIFSVKSVVHGFNQGADKLRFLNTVPAGSKVRMHMTVLSVDQKEDKGWRVKTIGSIEIEGQERPALYAEKIAVLYEGENG
jgi:acyl dehydratase